MKRKRFSAEQIVAILKQAELGMTGQVDLIELTGGDEKTACTSYSHPCSRWKGELPIPGNGTQKHDAGNENGQAVGLGNRRSADHESIPG